MKLTRRFLALILIIMLAGAACAAVPEGTLAVKTGDLQVRMTSKAKWTIQAVDLDGTEVIVPVGGQGACITVPGLGWVGSSMRGKQPEEVVKLSVTVDGVALSAKLPPKVEGKQVTVRKESRLATLAHTAETVIEGHEIRQRHTFEAVEATKLGTFNAFIYSCTPKAGAWLAKSRSGKVLRGTFKADRGSRPAGVSDWMAQYEAATGKGVLLYTLTPAAGTLARTSFWDTKSYHKALFVPANRKLKKGARVDMTLVMRFFSATPDKWEEEVTTMAAALDKKSPPRKAPPKQPASPYGKGVPSRGILTLKSKHCTVSLDASRAWTIHEMAHDNKVYLIKTGHCGQVMVPKGSRWWGTGHKEGGQEIVNAVTLKVDGKARPVKTGVTVSGKSLSLVKDATIWKFAAHVEVTLKNDHVIERARLTAKEDLTLKLLYYFMHSFPPTTTRWAAELADGQFVTGGFANDGNMEVQKDARWVAQYEPKTALGILCYFPAIVTGPRSMSKIWDKTVYHKYYTQQNLGQDFKKGETLDYTVVVKALPEETGDWTATKKAVAELMKLYPPTDAD